MGILDNVMNKGKKHNSLSELFAERESEAYRKELDKQAEQPIAAPATPQVNVSPSAVNSQLKTGNDGKLRVEQPQQNTASSGNPWNYSQSEMDELAKNGLTREKLEEIANLKIGDLYQRGYQSTTPKPSAPDEKKLRNRRIVAGIGDGISMLAQMWSAGKGAHVKERNDFALPKAATEEKEEQNKYQQLLQRYSEGLNQARLRDFERALNDQKEGKRNIQSILGAKRKLGQEQAQFEERQRFAYDKLAQEQISKDRDFELKKQNTESQIAQREAMVEQGWSRVADSRNRTTAYVRKMSSSGNGKNGGYEMIIEANPNDPNAVDDGFGNPVVNNTMTKGQMDYYARSGLADDGFMNSPAGEAVIKKRGDVAIGAGGKLIPGNIEYKSNQDIAAAYFKYRYDKQWESPPKPARAMPLANEALALARGQKPNLKPNLTSNYSNDMPEEEEIEMPEEDDLMQFNMGSF